MKISRYRTLDREWLLETIQEEELRMKCKRKKKKKKYVFTSKFYVICTILLLLFFSYIAPVMN